MTIKSFQIDHKKLKPGIYLHDIKKLGKLYVTTYDLRFKTPNKGSYLSNSQMHSLEHLMATFYTNNYKEKIYFGPMGCQTGFYLVIAGKHDLAWLKKSLIKLNTYINKVKYMPGNNPSCCGNYKTLNLALAKKTWHSWYDQKDKWKTTYQTRV